MSEQRQILKQSFSRATVFAVGLAALGIVLFVVLWLALGQAGLEALPRLIGALCIPPAVIAAIIGLYVLLARPTRAHLENHVSDD